MMAKNSLVEKPTMDSPPDSAPASPCLESVTESEIRTNGDTVYAAIQGKNLKGTNLRVAILAKGGRGRKKGRSDPAEIWTELHYADDEEPSKGYEVYLYDPSEDEVETEKFPFRVKVQEAKLVEHRLVLTSASQDDKVSSDRIDVYGKLKITFIR
jgi:hypothetical protein